MCSASVAVLLLATGEVNFFLAFALGMAGAALLGMVREKVAFRPWRGSHPLVPLISACDEMVIVKGTNICPSRVGQVLAAIQGEEPVYQ